jgi:Protein of unknown function (DUF2795)
MPAGFGDADAVKAALVDADYPATKDQLVQCAEAAQADEPTIKALRAMPPVDYGNLDEVLRSADFDVKAREEHAQ